MVVGSFTTGLPTDYAMTRLAGTDVWYLTVRVPSGSRFAYALSPNDPQTVDPSRDPSRAAQRGATVQGDPLNPRRWGCSQPNATRHDCQSMVELPGAPPQPWIVRNDKVPAGKVDKHKIASDLLKNERNLSVYTPPDYRANAKPYALLVLFDEGAYLNNVPTPVILDNLIAAGRIPPMVAVLIANPSQDTRNKELPPNPAFADFLATELLPWVHARYTVTSDPKLTTVAGSSYGGIAATYAGLRHPDMFGNVLCQSGSFWWAPERSGSVMPTRRRKPGGWRRSSSRARSCRSGSGWTRASSRSTRAAPAARSSSRAATCATCCSRKATSALPAVQQRPRLPQLARHAGRRPHRAGRNGDRAPAQPISA
jgi:enterochelin esterase family protein